MELYYKIYFLESAAIKSSAVKIPADNLRRAANSVATGTSKPSRLISLISEKIS
ncbi:MAG: hypothetical protein IJT73_07985 [Selenomonadaceae bacterium]|nr:hypothetical protein [Selenomonadaceae bacterium]